MPRFTRYEFLVQAIRNHNSDECLLWPFPTGGRYPQVWDGSTTQKPHRVAFALTNGPLSDGTKVRHTCDVTLCFNPRHLLPGTQMDNIHDAIERKRFLPKGEDHNMSKLTDGDVRTIRALAKAGKSSRHIAKEIGIVGASHIRAIVRGELWQHVA